MVYILVGSLDVDAIKAVDCGLESYAVVNVFNLLHVLVQKVNHEGGSGRCLTRVAHPVNVKVTVGQSI